MDDSLSELASRIDPRHDATLKIAAYAVVTALCVGVLVISFMVTPAMIESGDVVLSPPCTTKRVMGFDCPTCGMTRAFTALSHGDFGLALEYNRASPVVYGLFWLGALFALRALVLAISERLRLGRAMAARGAV